MILLSFVIIFRSFTFLTNIFEISILAMKIKTTMKTIIITIEIVLRAASEFGLAMLVMHKIETMTVTAVKVAKQNKLAHLSTVKMSLHWKHFHLLFHFEFNYSVANFAIDFVCFIFNVMQIVVWYFGDESIVAKCCDPLRKTLVMH